MSLRSVDMQVLLPKVAEALRNQPVQNQQDPSHQQQFALQFQKQAELQRHQVQTSNKSEGTKVGQQSAQNRSPNHENSRHQDEKEEEQLKDAKDPNRGKFVDIKI